MTNQVENQSAEAATVVTQVVAVNIFELASRSKLRFDTIKGVTTMSAESKTEPGGYFSYPQTLEQFHVSDERKAVEVDAALRALGRIPVYKDWDLALDRIK